MWRDSTSISETLRISLILFCNVDFSVSLNVSDLTPSPILHDIRSSEVNAYKCIYILLSAYSRQCACLKEALSSGRLGND
jgi:hypothetical protein